MPAEKNTLYPVFLKLHALRMLIVGAGAVGGEKLGFILKSSPEARITLLALELSREVEELLERFPGHSVTIKQKAFEAEDVRGYDILVAATNIPALNRSVYEAAKQHGILCNIADTPALCDFYMGSIVSKGPLKIGISTDGMSPTFAKRFREILEQALPDDIDELILHLKQFRDTLQGDFSFKVKKLNELTEGLLP